MTNKTHPLTAVDASPYVVSPTLAPYAVLVTLKTGEKVRVLAASLEAARVEAKANHGAKSAVVERNVDGRFVAV